APGTGTDARAGPPAFAPGSYQRRGRAPRFAGPIPRDCRPSPSGAAARLHQPDPVRRSPTDPAPAPARFSHQYGANPGGPAGAAGRGPHAPGLPRAPGAAL